MPGVATSSNKFAISPFIVDPIAGNGASYSTIASAITAATAAGGGTVYIKPGTYAENLTLATNVVLEGATIDGRDDPVEIDGSIAITAAGNYGARNIYFSRSAGGNLLSVTNAAGVVFALFSNCSFNPSAGIAINLASGVGASAGMIADLCDINPPAGSIGVQAVRGSFFMNDGTVSASGAASAISLGLTGSCRLYNHASITGGTSCIALTDASATAEIDDSVLIGGTASALVFTAAGTISIYHSRISSSGGAGNWASGAAGTLNYASVINLGTDLALAAGLTKSQKNWQQYSQTAAVAAGSIRGTSSFNSGQFSITDGFVSLLAAGSFPWADAAAPFLAVVQNGYFVTAAGAVTLPVAPTVGQVVAISDQAGGGVIVTASGTQTIRFGNVQSSAGGTATSSASGDSLWLIYRATSDEWNQIPGGQGIWVLA